MDSLENKSWIAVASLFLVTNLTAAITTYRAPKEEIKKTFSEQADYFTTKHFINGIGGGMGYTVFVMPGQFLGYEARKHFKN